MSLSCGHQSASGLLSVHLPTCGYKASRKQKGSAVVMALTGRGSGYYEGVRRSSSYLPAPFMTGILLNAECGLPVHGEQGWEKSRDT